jgi:hypothetical protein
MREYAGAVHRRIDNVVSRLAAGWLQVGEFSYSFRNLMIRTGSISADPYSPDNLSISVKWQSASKKDQAAGNLPGSAILPARRRQKLRIK